MNVLQIHEIVSKWLGFVTWLRLPFLRDALAYPKNPAMQPLTPSNAAKQTGQVVTFRTNCLVPERI
jgi:hypothetical protein